MGNIKDVRRQIALASKVAKKERLPHSSDVATYYKEFVEQTQKAIVRDAQKGTDYTKYFRESDTIPGMFMLHFFREWGDNGTPIFALDVDLALRLCSTDVSKVPLVDVKLPFSAFVIQVPNGILAYESSGDEGVRYCTDIMVDTGMLKCGPEDELEKGMTPVPVLFGQMWGENGALHTLQRLILGEKFDHTTYEELTATDYDGHQRLGRLIIGLPLYLASLKGDDKPKLRPVKQKKLPDGTVPLDFKTFDVVSKVKLSHDMRTALTLRSDDSRAAFEIRTRHIVRGHWRNQAHGLRNTLRRQQWIEPFWKGPEDGPTVVERTYT